jgi:hypothetical protein
LESAAFSNIHAENAGSRGLRVIAFTSIAAAKLTRQRYAMISTSGKSVTLVTGELHVCQHSACCGEIDEMRRRQRGGLEGTPDRASLSNPAMKGAPPGRGQALQA